MMSETVVADVDYKSTVFLPKTDFPMRAGLPKKEPEILAWWQEIDLYRRLRVQSKGREKFVLHDGPPYANGNLHTGHALNKILKDIVARSQQMMGRDSNYVPGWDCHGLPIEWRIEERYRAEGLDKNELPILKFRQECRDFAEHWVGVQSDEFQRLGVVGDWQDPYLTMSKGAEAQIVREIHKFVANGGLYKGLRPVLWSVVEKTALADAEVEYKEHTSTTVHVRFPIVSADRPSLVGASVVAWTTTPWTLPGNRALAMGHAIPYSVITVEGVAEGSLARPEERLVVASELVDAFAQEAGITAKRVEEIGFGDQALVNVICAHPLHGRGYDFDVPVFSGDFVTTEQGTGIVHIAPGHGEDDFDLGQANGIQVPPVVDEDGSYYKHVPLFAGKVIYTEEGKPGDANAAVVSAIEGSGGLLSRGRLRHSYPHSWRSKAPLIFRATSQWFISMDTNGLRETALKALGETRFVPPSGYNRLSSMIQTRPDWCISRQRAWGVPIAIFVNKETGEVLRDEAVLKRIADTFQEEGSDAWFDREPQYFLGNDYAAEDWTPVYDIVDVWFESGSSHAYVLEQRDDLKWPASLYLEGSDQHRGWFHSSLLESCGTRGRAPYDAVLTHGFILDEQGRKMSKSAGDSLTPQAVVDRSGADILRLWVVAMDYSEDLRFGPEILKYQSDAYRRLRNTLRYLLGALTDFDESRRVDEADMPELERWVLHRMAEMDERVRTAVDDFDFHTLYTALFSFCNEELSAFYFDVRKDALYCDPRDSLTRRAALTVMDLLFRRLTVWLAPILCFTAEEAWLTRFGKEAGSIHEQVFPEPQPAWLDPALAAKWQAIRKVRRVVTGALELERAEKRIGSSLQAHPTVFVTEALARELDGVDMAEIAIASAATVTVGEGPDDAFRLPEVAGVAVVSGLAKGEKCERCWRVLPDVGWVPVHPAICRRCADAVDRLPKAAA
ncbi:MAG: isoleucine--tRNA ligase [Pseudomonadota bacterium]